MLFCDLVGSTEIADRVDPEDFADILRAFNDTVAGIAVRYGGYVVRYFGDGALVSFGWPTAFEDQAERAVRAALDLTDEVARLPVDPAPPLAVRVAVASGLVVVGDLVGERTHDLGSVIGNTPNRAARIQTVVPAGAVGIDAATRDLVGGAFVLEALGGVALKGFAKPVFVWRVRGETPAVTRFQTARRAPHAELVGRTHELGLLMDRWRAAQSGEGQAVLVTGEAGIGKSRLLQSVCDGTDDGTRRLIVLQCAALHASSPLHPVVTYLSRAAGIADADLPGTRVAKLRAHLAAAGLDAAASGFLADGLMGPVAGPSGLPSQTTRALHLAALRTYLLGGQRRPPCLILVEDVHWADPTTRDLLLEVIADLDERSCLLVMTCRTSGAGPWEAEDRLQRLVLNRLSRQDSRELVARVADGGVSAPVRDRVVAVGDGIPLFLEELTVSACRSGDAPGLVPPSLQASLTARLDRLQGFHDIVQLASVIGRTFTDGFIREFGVCSSERLDTALAAMTEAGLLERRVRDGEIVYTFKHVLIQEAAYALLLKRERAHYHGLIADALLARPGGPPEPGIVAWHLSGANRPEDSAEYWLEAGVRSARASAHHEALANIEHALAQLACAPASDRRAARELDARIAFGISCAAIRGWATSELESNYERCFELFGDETPVAKRVIVLRGFLNVFFLRGEIAKARALADRETRIATDSGERSLRMNADRSRGMCDFFQGRIDTAVTALRQSLARYDPIEDPAQAYTAGAEPGVIAESMLGWALALIAQTRAAERACRRAVGLAARCNHPFSRAYAHSLAASVYQTLRLSHRAARHAGVAIAIARAHDFPYWRGWGEVIQGWAIAADGDVRSGLELLRHGLAVYEGTGARQIRAYAQALQAEILVDMGEIAAARDLVEFKAEGAAPNDVAFYDAELLRLRGLLMADDAPEPADETLTSARRLARGQGARLLELRAATAQVRLHRHLSWPDRANQILGPLLDQLGACAELPDVREARALLAGPGAGGPAPGDRPTPRC